MSECYDNQKKPAADLGKRLAEQIALSNDAKLPTCEVKVAIINRQ